jgi:hypothetical protein
LPSPSTPADGRSDYLEQLAAIREDPQVKALARAWARDPELAEDALQEAYYAMARVKNPDLIEDVRAYFCRVLMRKIDRIRGQLGAIVVDDFAGLAGTRRLNLGGEALPRSVDEIVITKLLTRKWLLCLASQRVALVRAVPGRSPNPGRYRDVIATVAEWMLLSILAGDTRAANTNLALCSTYQEWFAEDGVDVDNIYQRFARARADIRELLQSVISLDELRS